VSRKLIEAEQFFRNTKSSKDTIFKYSWIGLLFLWADTKNIKFPL